MTYFEETKSENEVLHYQEGASKKLIKISFIVGFIFTLIGIASIPVFIILGLLSLVHASLLAYTAQFIVSNQRVLAKTGFIKRSIVELNISKVESITIEQSVLGRLLNYGTLVFSGAGNPVVKIEFLENPMKFRKKCLEMSQNSKNQ